MEGSSFLEVMRKVPELVVHERMSQGKGVKGFKEKRKVSGWSMEEMREKPNIALEIDTERNEKMERSEPERNGPMLEEFGWKNGGGSDGARTKSKKAKKRLSEEEVLPRNGEGCAKTRNTE